MVVSRLSQKFGVRWGSSLGIAACLTPRNTFLPMCVTIPNLVALGEMILALAGGSIYFWDALGEICF